MSEVSISAAKSINLMREAKIYVGRVSQFGWVDWIVYVVWVGMMYGLLAVAGGFLWFGASQGVSLPVYVWNIPIGIFIFSTAIAFDTIGHRTVYREELKKGESLVHGITIFCGVGSCVLLTMAFDHPEFLRVPTLVLILLSVFYSMIDEALHWRRYFDLKSDRVEMISHFGIFLGHFWMIMAWWHWFDQGYPGFGETRSLIGQALGL